MLVRHHGAFTILASFLLALVLTVLPLPEVAQSFRPQWVALILIYWCLALPERVGIGIGWTCGIVLDVMTGTLLGQNALGLSLVAFLTLKLHQRTRLFPLWQQALTVLVLLLVERLLFLWVLGAVGQATPSLWYWMPPFVGMLLWPWLYVILRDTQRRFRVA